MSNIVAKERPPRVLFFGMQGSFSAPFLTALLDGGIEVAAVVVPASPIPGSKPVAIRRQERPRFARSILPLINTSLHSSIVQTAWAREIPVWEVQSLVDAQTITTLATYQPDSICVACFSLRIPSSIIELPRLGCLNVHPALLPANRGPVPLFWSFREGHKTTGVTIHLINEHMDSGDILAQESIPIADGISYEALELECIVHGRALLARVVWDLSAGQATRIPQDEGKSSYHSFPSEADFTVHAREWTARHVYNFIRGINSWENTILLYTGEKTLQVQDALAYKQKSMHHEHRESNAACANTTDVWIHCKVGKVQVRVYANVP